MIAIYSKNREEWVLCEQACHMQSVVIVTLYDTYGQETIEYILNQTSISTVICSDNLSENVRKCKKTCPNLLNIVQFGVVNNELSSN